MLRRLYDWTLSLAARKSAEYWLAIIAFIESSIFLVPADVLYLPMALSRPDRAYRYALVATAASVLGGIAGWFLGYYAYEAIAKPVLEFYGKLDEFEALRGVVERRLHGPDAGHIGPGASAADQGRDHPRRRHQRQSRLFILSAIIARGARFFFLAWLLRTYGEPIRHFIEKRLGADRRRCRRRPYSALHRRQIRVLSDRPTAYCAALDRPT